MIFLFVTLQGRCLICFYFVHVCGNEQGQINESQQKRNVRDLRKFHFFIKNQVDWRNILKKLHPFQFVTAQMAHKNVIIAQIVNQRLQVLFFVNKFPGPVRLATIFNLWTNSSPQPVGIESFCKVEKSQ